MCLVERALAGQTGHNRDGEVLGQSAQLGVGFRPVNALPGVDRRVSGGDQQLGRGFDLVLRRLRAHHLARRIVEHARVRLGEHVVGQFDHHRLRTPVAQHRERPAQHRHDLTAAGQRFRVLGVARHRTGRVEVERHVHLAERIALRHHQHRHAFGKGLGDAAHRILRAGALLHHEHAHLAALAHAAHRVGHVQPGALLPDDHRADVDPRGGFENLIARIAEDRGHAFALQDCRDRVGDGAVGVDRLIRLAVALSHAFSQDARRALEHARGESK